MKKYYPYINNSEFKTTNFNKIYSPVDNQLIAEVGLLTKQNINEIYEISDKTFETWKNSSASTRIKILEEWIVNLEKNKDEIAEMMGKEIAKNYKSSVSEIDRSIIFIKEMIKIYFGMHPEFYDCAITNKKKYAFYKRQPLGVILCISPFNYPINLAISKIAPALLTGNCVVFKSATQASITSLLLSKTLIETSIPKGVFNVVTGKGSEIGDILNSNKYIKLINFTGSTLVGKNLHKKTNFCNFILELGGNDAAVVLNNCDIDDTAEKIIKGTFSYNGQRCTAIKRVIVEKNISRLLIEKLVSKAKKLKIGKPNENADITAIIDKNSKNFIISLINDALAKNAKLELGNKIEDNIIHPTILSNINKNMDIFRKEQFGPVLPILVIENNKYDEIIKIVNDSEYGLQNSIFTQDIDLAMFFANKLESGTVNINNFPERGPDYLPFLGVKDSGLNMQGIKKTLEACSILHGITITYKEKIN